MKRASVADKVVAVTGGARGIGLATATVLQGLGAKVAIGDIDRSAVKEASNWLGLEIGRRLDVTDRRSFADFLDTVEERLGTVDVVVNNAGVIAVGSAVDEADAVTDGARCQYFGVILAPSWLPSGCCRAVTRHMHQHRHRNLLRHKACRARLHRRRANGKPWERCALLGHSADPGQYRDDCRRRAREGLQERRTGRRRPGGCRSDRQDRNRVCSFPVRSDGRGRPAILPQRVRDEATGTRIGQRARLRPATSRSTSAQPMPGALVTSDSQSVRTSKSASTG